MPRAFTGRSHPSSVHVILSPRVYWVDSLSRRVYRGGRGSSHSLNLVAGDASEAIPTQGRRAHVARATACSRGARCGRGRGTWGRVLPARHRRRLGPLGRGRAQGRTATLTLTSGRA